MKYLRKLKYRLITIRLRKIQHEKNIRMKFIACITTLLSWVTRAKIEEITEEMDFTEYIEKHEYAVVDYFDSSEGSQDLTKIFERAEIKWSAAVRKGQIKERDVGWYKVNIEKQPVLKPEEL